jgi:hypothetical protein
MFRGTLKPETILASIEFVDALVEFVKTVGSAFILSDKAWTGFVNYVKRSNYKYLYDYMVRREVAA